MQSRVFIGIWTASTKFKGYDLGCVAPWVVYIVRCRDGSLYTGATCDLPARLLAHNAGKGARYTRSRRPIELVFSQRTRGKSAALSRECRTSMA